MIFVDDLKMAINVMLHPDKATKSWSVGGALGTYWKVAVIPMILSMIVAAIAASALASFGTLGAVGNVFAGWGIASVIVGTLVIYLIGLPISLLISAVFVQIVGKGLKVFKGGYAATVSALVYETMPYLVLSWIPIISIIGYIWSIVVGVFAISNIQKTSKLMAFVAWIGGAVLFGIIVFIIVLVAGLGSRGGI